MVDRCGAQYLLVEKLGSSLAPRANQIESIPRSTMTISSITSHRQKHFHSCALLLTDLNFAAVFDRYDECHNLLLRSNQLDSFSFGKSDIHEALKKSHNHVPSFR